MKLANKILAIAMLLLSFDIQCHAVSQDAATHLTLLSQKFTDRFLKNGYSQADIDTFAAYVKSSGIKSAFCIYTFKNAVWTMHPVLPERKDSYPHTRFATELLTWLNTHVTKDIKDGLSFVYMPQEPVHECGFHDQKQQLELKALFEKCPILLTCTHPNILWSESAILVPDPYIMSANYQATIDEILQKRELTYKNRMPFVFFRGAISGPHSYVYRMESLGNDDRLKLFMLSKNTPFINAMITSDDCLTIPERVTPDFKTWYQQNLADKKGAQANFIEHARHKYLISLDGYGSAWSRVPYILFTGSVLLLRADCKQYFYSLLGNMHTHVTIDPGLTNLTAVYTHLEQNPDVAESIANNGHAFASNYLTKDAINMYLSQVIRDLNNAFRTSV
jgi:hypothetical protein